MTNKKANLSTETTGDKTLLFINGRKDLPNYCEWLQNEQHLLHADVSSHVLLKCRKLWNVCSCFIF